MRARDRPAADAANVKAQTAWQNEPSKERGPKNEAKRTRRAERRQTAGQVKQKPGTAKSHQEYWRGSSARPWKMATSVADAQMALLRDSNQTCSESAKMAAALSKNATTKQARQRAARSNKGAQTESAEAVEERREEMTHPLRCIEISPATSAETVNVPEEEGIVRSGRKSARKQ